MMDFLNISLFEMFLESSLIQNAKYSIVWIYVLCILKIVMFWPLMHLFYKITYNCLYFLDRNKNNRDNLRSSKIKVKCREDIWREYWECKDNVHGLAPSAQHECFTCEYYDKKLARCKNIKMNDRRTSDLYLLNNILCVVFAFLICNPISVIKYLGFTQGMVILAIALFINPIFVSLSYRIFNFKLFIKQKHGDPYANINTEMHEDGSFYRYWQTLPAGCKGGSPEAAYAESLNGGSSNNKAWEHYNPQSDALKRQWEAQDLSNSLRSAGYLSYWWW